MTTSWTFSITCTINGVDVTDCMLKHTIRGNHATAVVSGTLELNRRALSTLLTVTASMPVTITRHYVVTMSGGTPTNVDQVIFRGYTLAPTESKGRVTVPVQDRLMFLLGEEINKIYGTSAVPVDLGEIAYDIITSAGLPATYNVEGATVQKSGVTTKGKTFAHVNSYSALKELAQALNWQFYYHPGEDKVFFEPKGFQTANKPTLTESDWSGRPAWVPDSTQLCNQCTVLPKPINMVGPTFYHTLTSELNCEAGAVLSLTVPRKPYKFQVAFTTPSEPYHSFVLVGRQMITQNPERRMDEDYAYIPDRDGPNLFIFQNGWYGGTRDSSAFHNYPAGTKFEVMYYYTGPVPQTYTDVASKAAYGLKAKTISRPDLSREDALQFARAYVGWFKDPLDQVTLQVIHDPTKFIWLGSVADVVDPANGKNEEDMVLVSFELNWPRKVDTYVLGKLQTLTSDYTTGLEARIKHLESSAIASDYTQGQYTPLGSSEPGGDTGSGGTPTGTIVLAAKTVMTDSSTAVAGLGIANQGKLFYDNGHYFVFWFDGTNIVYRSSEDLETWGAKIPVVAESAGSNFTCLCGPDHKVHYVRGNGSSLKYRRGTVGSDGTIAWDLPEVDALAGGSAVVARSIALASDGQVLYAYQRDGNVFVNKVSYSGGSLTAASGYPKQLTSGSALTYHAAIVTAPDTDVWYCAYGDNAGGTKVRGRFWNGSTLGSEEICSLGVLSAYYRFSAVMDASYQVHLTYNKQGGDYRAMYRMRSAGGSWDASEYDVAGSAVSYLTIPYIARAISGQQYVYWFNSPTAGKIYYRGHSVTGVWDSAVIEAHDEGSALPSPDACLCASAPEFNGIIGLAYMTDASSPYTVKLLKMSFDGTGSGGGGTPSSGGRVTVSGSILNGPDGNPIYLHGTGDSVTWPGMCEARGGSYSPSSTPACPVQGLGTVNTSDAESIATAMYRYGLALQSQGHNYIRLGVHAAWGTDRIWTQYNANVTQFDRVLVAMAQGLEASGIYFSFCCSGFAETPVEEGGDGYANRRLLTSQTSIGSHLSATGYLTDNILHVGSTSFNNFVDFCAHVGDKLANFPHFVALELSNEPDNWRQCPVYWNAQYGDDMSAYGAVEQAMRNWGSTLAASIRAKRSKSFNLMMGWTPLVGPPWHTLSTTGTVSNPAALITYLNAGMDIAAYHAYHFSPIYCDSTNSGQCDGTVCGQTNLHTAIKQACAQAGMPALNDEWGRYCDSAQVWVQSIADTLASIGVHHACIVPPSRPTAGSQTLPAGWAQLGV